MSQEALSYIMLAEMTCQTTDSPDLTNFKIKKPIPSIVCQEMLVFAGFREMESYQNQLIIHQNARKIVTVV